MQYNHGRCIRITPTRVLDFAQSVRWFPVGTFVMTSAMGRDITLADWAVALLSGQRLAACNRGLLSSKTVTS